MLAQKLLGAMAGGAEQIFSDDVFSSFLYTGNGSTQTITNGIDLAGKGGLVWLKGRSGANSHGLLDTVRGQSAGTLSSDTTGAQTNNNTVLSSFNSNGFTFGTDTFGNVNTQTYVSWTFRKAARFFDCGTYTGNGVAGRQIPHSLGVAPGMVIVKSTSGTTVWSVWHRSANGGAAYGVLNLTDAFYTDTAGTSVVWGNGTSYVAPTDSNFTVGTNTRVNDNGATYVWYAFAHDTSAEGIVQCGSYTVPAGGVSTVNLGWEPQLVLVKCSSAAGTAWNIADNMRGMAVSGNTARLFPNLSNAESNSGLYITPTATGFQDQGLGGVGDTYIYLAIRRPNKPPTTGTQVYNAIARTGTGAAATVTGVGFAPDFVIPRGRASGYATQFCDRLRGSTANLTPSSTAAEAVRSDSVTALTMDGMTLGVDSYGDFNQNTIQYINHFFKRAPGVFENFCFSGTGANKTEAHGLGVAPELWLVKRRNSTGSWVFGSTALLATEKLVMPSPNGRVTDATAWNSTYPTASVLSLGSLADVNASGGTFVAYLWASLAGVSKVFTYTGNGSTQTVNCGFSSGARFVMIIRATASTAQDVFVWDSARGIIAGNDPRLSLNTTAAELTSLDTIDPDSSGFAVNSDSSNINVNGAVYFGVAYA